MKRIILALALVAACGGSQSSGTGSIEGTVKGAQALTVSVPGTSKSTTTDSTGAFVLVGVPAGTSQLHFSSSANDATATIAAVVDSEHRSLSVTISGHSAEVDEQHEDTDFHGPVSAVAPPNLTVAGRTVVTSASTKITRGDAVIALSDVKVGEVAAVEGALQTDGSVVATSVHVGTDGEHPPNFTAFVGTLNKIDGATLTVGVLPVVTSSSTQFFRGDVQVAIGDLAVGQQLLVVGVVDAAQGVLAARIRIIVPDDGSGDARIQGTLNAIGDHAVTINDAVVAYTTSTEIDGYGDPHAIADLHVGDLIEAEVTKQADGSLLAKELKRLQPPPPPSTDIDFKGSVENLGVDGVTISGQRFAVDAHTVITIGEHTVTLADLHVGEAVEVHATARTSPLPPLATAIHADQ